MKNNLFYLSGPHGSGKTTLEKELCKMEPLILVPNLISNAPTFNDQPKYRQNLKICERAIENYEYLLTAKHNPDRIILGNRCFYDVVAYNEVYLNRKWITLGEKEFGDNLAERLFFEENRCPNVIILNPDFEIIKSHLQKRWTEKSKKWREEDLEYVRCASLAYQKFKDQENVFYIDKEVDISGDNLLEELCIWMRNKYLHGSN
jgi:thymidylate kinase